MARPLEEQTFLQLVRAAGRLVRESEEILRGADLTGKQYNILRILRGAGADGLACAEIGARMLDRDPDITRLLDRLGKRKLLERRRSGEDRRVVRVRITAGGLELLDSLETPILRQHRQSMRPLTRRQLQELHDLLTALQTPG